MIVPRSGTADPRRHKNHGGERCPGGEPKKPSGGRPRKHRYFELFGELGDPPDDPLKLCAWAQRVNALALRETVCGRGCESLNAEIRASSKVIAALVPRTTLERASSQVRGEVKKSTGKRNQPRGSKLSAAPTDSKPVR